jgi:hypothetical protein
MLRGDTAPWVVPECSKAPAISGMNPARVGATYLRLPRTGHDD